jgi:predicted metal-binding membrane protein
MADARIMFAMWWVMMVGMMLPSAAPMILTFATINRKKRERSQPYVPTTIFALGYLTAWGAFSVFATAAQWGLQQAALLSPMLIANNVYLAGALFVCAGLYQWTPLKHLCLKNCRSPLNYIINSWRNGRRGAFVMGWQHGLYCLGCCWLVMGLLFAIGIMNLVWVATIATFVFLEKLFPRGEVIARISGVLMTAFGAYLVVTG